MIRTTCLALGALCLATTTACSRTAPESQWPPPGPRAGLPYIPLPSNDDDIFGLEQESEEPATPAATKGPSAIDAALPDSPMGALARKSECKDKQCVLKAWLPDPAFAKAAPGGEQAPAAVWAEKLAAGSTLVLPRNHELEVLAVVMSGKVLLAGDDGGAPKELGVWGAARAPGAGVTVRAQGGAAEVIFAVVTSKDTLADSFAHAKQKPWEVRWKKRQSPIASVSLKDAKDYAWGGGAFHARFAFGGTEQKLPSSLETLLASADASIPEHAHDDWEHIVILEGSGTMKVAGKDHPVAPGAVYDLPKGVKHSFSPSGKSRLLAVQLYTPSGAERRFVKLAEASKVPAAK
jgi:mannose-6-phosphate isomerase-like protein (cupin superfamily)